MIEVVRGYFIFECQGINKAVEWTFKVLVLIIYVYALRTI